MRAVLSAVAMVVLAMSGALGGRAPIFEADFDGETPLDHWGGAKAQIVDGYNGTPSLLITNDEGEESVKVLRQLSPEKLAGRLVTLEAIVRAANVGQPPEHWNGIKVMLILRIGDGRHYPQVPIGWGTFDWSHQAHVIRVPRDITAATLCLGLERASGKVWFDNVRITEGRPRNGPARGQMFKGHDLPRLRGVMHGPEFNHEDIRDLAEWGANQVRWQLNWVPMKEAEEWAQDLEEYDRWLDGALGNADKAIDACEEYGIKVLLDLHCPPGGRAAGGVCRLFTEERYRDKLLSVWERIAARYEGRSIIYAYDLLNEPVEPNSGAITTWKQLATEAIERIRAIEPDKPVVFEPGPWGGCAGFDQITPLELDRVIYSFHMYQPHKFTHQFKFDGSYVYPGTIDGVHWDKERLRQAMQPAVDFQQDFNVHIYVGEFSAIRWAPDNSAYRYLRDLIDLFEEYGWDWSYHAFREWSGWSVEHSTDRQDGEPSATPTDREKLLRGWFAKNERAPR